MFKKTISLFLSLSLIITQPIFAQGLSQLNLAQYLGQIHPSATDIFRPTQLRYFSYDNLNNSYRILLDKGDLKDIKDNQLKEEAKELMDYFLIGLALPNDTFWVNLRPDSPDNIIDPELEKTDLGRILLEADLQLKKDTAGLTSPQAPEGKAYWDKLYKKAGELFGNENITIPTLTRPWIVPGEIIVRESQNSAYIYKATLKVMLEEDYLKSPSHKVTRSPNNQPLTSNYTFSDPRLKELNEYSTQIIRETIIPKITREVNSSKKYAKLMQVYYSLVLSRWFKMRFSGKSGQYADLIDKHDLTNLTTQEPYNKRTYFKEYQESFVQGEYNLKEPVYTPYGQSVRSYMSGGFTADMNISGPGIKAETASNPAEEQLLALPGKNTVILDNNLNIIDPKQPLTLAASPLIVDDVVNILEKTNKDFDDLLYIATFSDNEKKSIISVYDSIEKELEIWDEFQPQQIFKKEEFRIILNNTIVKLESLKKSENATYRIHYILTPAIAELKKLQGMQQSLVPVFPIRISIDQFYVLANNISLLKGPNTGGTNIGNTSLSDGSIINHPEWRSKIEKRMEDALGNILHNPAYKTEKERNERWESALKAEGVSGEDTKSLNLDKDKYLSDDGISLELKARYIVNKITNVQLKEIIAYARVHPIKQTILYLGEMLWQREKGLTMQVLERDMSEILKGITADDISEIGLKISYEPRDLPKGISRDLAQIEKDHFFIKETFRRYFKTEIDVYFVIGLTPENANSIFALPSVDGAGLGASAKEVDKFMPYIKAAIEEGKKKGKPLAILMNWKAENKETGLEPLGNFTRLFKNSAFDWSMVTIAIATPNVHKVKMEILKVKNYYWRQNNLSLKTAETKIPESATSAVSAPIEADEGEIINAEVLENISGSKKIIKLFSDDGKELIKRYPGSKELYEETENKLEIYWKTKETYDIQKAVEAALEFYAAFQSQGLKVEPEVENKIKILQDTGAIINGVVEKIKFSIENDIIELGKRVNTGVVSKDLNRFSRELSLKNSKATVNYILFLLSDQFKPYRGDIPESFIEDSTMKYFLIKTELEIFDFSPTASSAMAEGYVIDNEVRKKIENIKYALMMFSFKAREFTRDSKFKKELEELYQEANKKIMSAREANDIIGVSDALREFYAATAGFQFQESSVMPEVSEKLAELAELDELKSIIDAVVGKVKNLMELDMTAFEEVILNKEDVDFTDIESIIKELNLNNLKPAALEMKDLFEEHHPKGYSEYARKWASIITELKIFDLPAASSALTVAEMKRQIENILDKLPDSRMAKYYKELISSIEETEKLVKSVEKIILEIGGYAEEKRKESIEDVRQGNSKASIESFRESQGSLLAKEQLESLIMPEGKKETGDEGSAASALVLSEYQFLTNMNNILSMKDISPENAFIELIDGLSRLKKGTVLTDAIGTVWLILSVASKNKNEIKWLFSVMEKSIYGVYIQRVTLRHETISVEEILKIIGIELELNGKRLDREKEGDFTKECRRINNRFIAVVKEARGANANKDVPSTGSPVSINELAILKHINISKIAQSPESVLYRKLIAFYESMRAMPKFTKLSSGEPVLENFISEENAFYNAFEYILKDAKVLNKYNEINIEAYNALYRNDEQARTMLKKFKDFIDEYTLSRQKTAVVNIDNKEFKQNFIGQVIIKIETEERTKGKTYNRVREYKIIPGDYRSYGWNYFSKQAIITEKGWESDSMHDLELGKDLVGDEFGDLTYSSGRDKVKLEDDQDRIGYMTGMNKMFSGIADSERYKDTVRYVLRVDYVENGIFRLTVNRNSKSNITIKYTPASSSLIAKQKQLDNPSGFAKGGIDFTDKAMRIGLEPMGSFADLKLVLPEVANVAALDLDAEFKQIQVMASSGIRPADTRILEFAAACYYRGEFSSRLGEITACLQQAHFLDELLGKESSPALRLATMLPEVLYSHSLN